MTLSLFQEADFSDLEASVTLPEGYIIASVGEYPDGQGPLGTKLDYSWSVQILNQSQRTFGRGTGNTLKEALGVAIKAVEDRGF